MVALENNLVPGQQFKSLNEFREALQNYTKRLNVEPDKDAYGATPDGKAVSVYISHIEMTLDEFYFGLWETENFKWQVVANEVIAAIDLIVTHPVTGLKLRRVGAAAIQIMVDRIPDEIKDKRERNQWTLDLDNKKPAALDMGFPKLKADCIKNAAISLGKKFGRDLNRDAGKTDTFNPIIKPVVEIPDELRAVIGSADENSIALVWTNNPTFHNNPEFFTLLNKRKEELRDNKKPADE